MPETAWLDCPSCGEDAIPSGDDGMFHEDMPSVVCPGCKTLLRVVVYDEGFDDEDNEINSACAQEVDDDA